MSNEGEKEMKAKTNDRPATDEEVRQAREQTRGPGNDLSNDSVRKLIARVERDQKVTSERQ